MEHTVSVSAPDVDPSDVRTFCRVVDLGSMTAAAHSLGETKGSVSRRVARLERALGLPLVLRTGRRVVPTEDGLVYRQKAGYALDLLDDAAATLRDLRGTPTGHLRITAPIGLGTQLLGRLVAPFMDRYPQVTLQLVLTDAVLSFGQDRIDVALRITSGLPDSSLIAYRLFGLDSCLVAAPAYLERHGAPSHPGELFEHRMLTVPLRGSGTPMSFERVDGSGDTIDQVVVGHLMSHDLLLLREAALAGAGITALPRTMAERDVTAGRLAWVMPEYRLASSPSVYLLHAGGVLSPKVRAFRDFMREAIRAQPDCPNQ